MIAYAFNHSQIEALANYSAKTQASLQLLVLNFKTNTKKKD